MRVDIEYRQGEIVFVWDRRKAETVLKKRGIPFEEAASAMFDLNILEEPDPKHPEQGHYIGESSIGHLLLVVYVEVEDDQRIRLITAWQATPAETKRYQQQYDSRRKAVRSRKRTVKRRDPDHHNRRPTFLEFLRLHGIPRQRRRPLSPKRSRLAGRLGRGQERWWALERAAEIPAVGERLRALRRTYEWSQTELAQRSGIDSSELSRLERGVSPLVMKHAKALGKALGVQPAFLLWRTPNR